MADFLQLIVSGCATGAIYALAALGFTLLWQAAGVINFAQGEFVMLPAFGILFFIAGGAPLWLAFLLTCAVAMLVLGYGFKRGIVDPLIKHGVIPLVIATLGLSIAVKSIVRAGYSAEAHPFPNAFPAGQWELAGLNVSYADRGTLIVAGAIVVGLQAFLNKTVTGRAMQAVAQTPRRRRCSASTCSGWCSSVPDQCGAGDRGRAADDADLPAKFDMGDSIGRGILRGDHRRLQPDARGALLGGILIGVLENLVGLPRLACLQGKASLCCFSA
jgi:branched-chain amino acid transport system permease protein